MGKITGKCKEDFETYIESVTNVTSMYSFRSMPEACQNALIIEFFDSVNLLIQIKGRLIHHHKSTVIEPKFDCYTYHEKLTMRLNFNTRLEATNYAVKRTNEIYNSKNDTK